VVDAGYVRARNILASRQEHEIDLVGPVDPEHQWQGHIEGGFVTASFHLEWEHRVALCPEGRQSIRWNETTGPRGRVRSPVSWDRDACLSCPRRARCTPAKTGAHTLLLPSRAEHDILVAGRRRHATAAFQQGYAKRAGSEGTLSQAVRALGLRQARYRGLDKCHLQSVATAPAVNGERNTHWLTGTPLASTRCTPVARLAGA
jgi:transposase